MRRAMLCVLALAAFALSADKPAALPDSVRPARAKYEAALAEARKTLDAATRKADKELVEELSRLQTDASKAGRLEEAVALRDAAKGSKASVEGKPIGEWLRVRHQFALNHGKEVIDIGPAGWRSSLWRPGWLGRVDVVGSDSLRLTVPAGPSDAGKSHVATFSPDRTRAVAVNADGHFILSQK